MDEGREGNKWKNQSFKDHYGSRVNYGNDKINEQMEELRKMSKRNQDYQSR